MLSKALQRLQPTLNRRALRCGIPVQQMQFMNTAPQRYFSADVTIQQEEEAQMESEEQMWARIGADQKFDRQKHAYVLTFPWNFPEIVGKFEAGTKGASGYWPYFMEHSRAIVEFNILFREFHQFCALPDEKGIERICEGRLAQAVNQSVERIQFHGLDIEMANLTVEQPSIKVLKVEVNHGVSLERDANGPKEAWNITESSILGAPAKYYTPADDKRDFMDGLDEDHRPYNVAFTCLIESPMKMYVQNQNYSKILFGSDDQETVKNIVRFEANLKWTDLLSVMPVNNKKAKNWKITDWNNIMNENPHY